MAADDHPSPSKPGKTTATGVMSPNATKKPKERVPVRPDLEKINQYLMCSLCSGYLIDAHAIIECQHTFCKSCILKYLASNGYCPICDIELNTFKPHLSLRSDVIVQRLVYKLVPGLLCSELKRRRDHAESKNNAKAAESVSEGMALEVDAASDVSTILSLDDVVSLSIEYFRGTGVEEPLKVTKQQLAPQQHKQEQQKPTTIVNMHNNIQDVSLSKDSNEANDRRRYLKCPAAVSVGLLKKFIRMKYGLSEDYRVDLLYNGVRDNSLENDLTLLDIAFIFKWNKDEPMRFHYRIFDRNVKNLTTQSGTKRSASYMMDEPPDDDGATSGKRPPMTSASPSSKIPRVSNNTSTGASNNRGNTGGSYRSTSTMSSSTPVYDFSEGNSDTEEPLKKSKLKLRGLRNENSSNSSESSKSGSQVVKRSPSNLRSLYASRSQSYEDNKATEAGSGTRRASGTKTYRGRSNSVGTSGNDVQSEDEESDSSSESDGAKNADLTNSRVRSAAQTVMQSQVNGSIKLNMSACNVEKREPLKLSLGSVIARSPEHKHKHKHHHKLKHKKKHKPLKLSLSLNPNSNSHASVNPQSQSNHKLGGNTKLVKVSGEKGTKLIFGLGQNKVAESKGTGTGNGSSGSVNSPSNFPVNVKPATSAHLSNISKSISVSIGVGNNQIQTSNSTATMSGKPKQNQFSKTLTPTSNLHPKTTGIEKQPSTNLSSTNTHTQSAQQQNSNSSSNSNHSASRSHPLLPESVHVPKSVTLIPVNPNGMGSTGSSTAGRVGSSGNVIEKSGSNNSTSNRLNNAHTFTHPITNKSLHQITVTEVPPPPKSCSPASGVSIGSANNNPANNSNTGNVPSNPIEKVINAANKPQFHGPGSMEITKIYCSTKENSAKKLKERKGLDISITVPGMNMKDKKPNKLEETLRQKAALSGSGTTMTINNKVKGNSQPSGPIFNAKMPPGITIGPAGLNKTASASTHSNATNSGNIIPGLGFPLPPHITAHPQNTSKNVTNQVKPNEKSIVSKNMGGKNHVVGNNKMKDSISHSQKVVAPNKGFDNRKQLGEALASMLDMANRNALKSPSPPKNCQQNKDNKALVKSTQPASVNCEKRALDMSSSSRKNSRESPEPKRSKTNDSSNSKSSANESPLDLSGRSSRPNSNSSSPIHQMKNHSNSSPTLEKTKHNNESIQQPVSKKSPTPAPKTSPPGFSSSHSGKSGQKATTPTGSSPSILSIAQSLAQKQLSQQQQQQQQNLHNQIMQLHKQNMHSTNHNQVGTAKVGNNSLSPKGVSGGNMVMGGSGSGSKGLNSLSPPIISMPNPSPPGTGFDPLRNLLSDAAIRHAKTHPMNLMASVGLCQPPPHTHHGLSLPSPSSVNFPHLANSLVGKSPTSLLDPQSYLAAISAAHNERLAAAAAAAAGMSHFGDAMSPSSMSMSNSYFSQVRPPSSNPHGSLRIPSVTPKSNSANNNGKKQGSSTPPLTFSHPPIVSAPHSPTKVCSSSPVSISSSSSSSHSKSLDIKNTKINGTSFPTHLPILPPGIHNPLLPNYSRTQAATNLISNCATSNTGFSSNKVVNSDKKGIPNSMKISNFLPNKPKDGKGTDTANVEATITSGSNVGASSLTKFLNSIPPLIVSQSQSNLSVSSSTLAKDSSRVFNAFNNKSSNEQECLLSKSKSLPSSSSHTKTTPTTSSSNPIKKESEKPIITSSAPLKSNVDPITCQTNASTPTSSSKLNEETAKSNSTEIKSEVGSLMSCSKGGSLGHGSIPLVGLSPPSARTTQPQNQAVRHIPNPALLFNRQKSSPLSPTNEAKSLIFNQKHPLQLDDHAILMPALSFPAPGVSVPVQVKVDNDALPIPIPSVDHIKTEPTLREQVEKTESSTTLDTRQEKQNETPTTKNKLLIAACPKKEVEAENQECEPTVTQTSNQICKEEEIVKIEYTTDDIDQDIDVGIEATPIFPTPNETQHEEKPVPSTETHHEVQISNASHQNETQNEQIQIQPCRRQDNEIKTENTGDLNEAVADLTPGSNAVVDETQVYQNVTNSINSASDESEQIKLHTSQTLEPECVEIAEEMDTTTTTCSTVFAESESSASAVVGRQVETETQESSETLPATEAEKVECDPISIPMELHSGEVKASPELELSGKSEKVVQDQTLGEISEEVEMRHVDDNAAVLSVEAEAAGQVITTNNNTTLQIEDVEMQCEDVAQPNPLEDNQMETDEIDEVHLIVADCNVQNADVDQEMCENVQDAQESPENDNQQMLTEPVLSLLPEKALEENISTPVMIQPVQEQDMEADNDDEATELNSVLHLQTDSTKLVFNSDSNLIPNQITINPEALLQVQEKSSMEIAAIVNEPEDTKETSDTKSDNALNNSDQAREVAQEELMESSSASQLEMNCPSADTNGIELSNPVAAIAVEQESDNSSVHHVGKDEGSSKKYVNPETNTQLLQLAEDKDTISSIRSCASPESVVASVEDKSEGNCQNIITLPPTSAEDEKVVCSRVLPIVPEESTLETPTERKVDPQLTTTCSSQMEQVVFDYTDLEENSQTFSEQELELVTGTALPMAVISGDQNSIPIISATATITTTTTSEITTSVLELSSIESPPSSRNSLESPASPEDSIKKIESFEKVAAGLFATAANNNNNTSLTINTSTCDIPITTTTSANDITIV